MADPVATPDDIVMSGAVEGADPDGEPATEDEPVLPGDVADGAKRIGFVDYLRSPIVELEVGEGADKTTLYAHQDLLTKSSFFDRACGDLTPGNRTIPLPAEDLDATGSFLEYLYNGEYFPRLKGERKDAQLESDPSLPNVDEDGDHLLKHARVYTLAERFDMPALRSIAHRKIQATTSTARGEIAYARYVYSTTSASDSTIRSPVAAFWATRSHVLRHEAEEEFRAMCLEFPQFGFDVLSKVLDQKEKGRGGGLGVSGSGDAGVGIAVAGSSSGAGGLTPGGSGRGKKRSRVSAGVE